MKTAAGSLHSPSRSSRPTSVNRRQSIAVSRVSANSEESQSVNDSPIPTPSFMSIISEQPPKLVEVATERDFLKIYDTIVAGLSNNDDWQKRINALVTLQGICPSAMRFESFIPSLRSSIDLVSFHRSIVIFILSLPFFPRFS